MDVIKIITGIRRCGKSYFLNLIMDELKNRGINEENIIHIDLEHPKYNYMEKRKEFDDILIPILEKGSEKKYLLIDEIQNIDEWEKALTVISKHIILTFTLQDLIQNSYLKN